MKITQMKIEDFSKVIALWRQTEGMGLDSDVDSKAGIARYLKRNPGLSFVARDGSSIVGAVLCGHDGRRGYLHHLAVDTTCRNQGIGKALVDHALAGLAKLGIVRCHLFVYRANRKGQTFWTHTGWSNRTDLHVMSKSFKPSPCCC